MTEESDQKPLKNWKLPWVPFSVSCNDGNSKQNIKYANLLHSSILVDVKKKGYDICGDRYFPESDSLYRSSKSRVENAKTFMNDPANGPSAIREQFSSKDWRKWNDELSLLEDLSRKDTKKDIVIEKPKPIRTKNYKGPGLLFASPIDPSVESLAGAFAASKTSVIHILTQSLSRQLPKYDPQLDSVYDPYNLGLRPAIGGATTSAIAHELSGINTTTKNCDIPSVDKIKTEKGAGKFLTSPRFKHSMQSQQSSPSSNANDFEVPISSQQRVVTPSVAFSRDIRFRGGKDNIVGDSIPGPGSYNVDRLFDPNPSVKLTSQLSRDANSRIETVNSVDDFSFGKMRAVDYAGMVGFGFGCSRQEHVIYGMCSDGQCGKRAPWEQVMSRGNDISRAVGHETPATILLKSRVWNNVDIPEGEERSSIKGSDDSNMTPLFAAVYKCDIQTIKRLKTSYKQINIIEQSTGYAPIHVVVAQCQLEALEVIVHIFRKHIDLNLQDARGDTPLHIAARFGFDEILSVLCDNGADPMLCKNIKGQSVLDVSKAHATYQLLKAIITEMELSKELSLLRE